MSLGRNVDDTFLVKPCVILWVLLGWAVSACSLDASLIDLSQLNPILKVQDRKEPDFVSGEVVTTGSGVVITGSFGEISEKYSDPSSGIAIEGAFYE